MKKTFFKFSTAVTLAVSALFPVLAHAQYIPQGGDAKVLLFGALGLLPLIPKAIFAIAIIAFLLAIVNMYLLNGAISWLPTGGEKGDEKGKTTVYMILGLFVMFSIYGIIAIISNTLGIGVGGRVPPQPEIPIFDGR